MSSSSSLVVIEPVVAKVKVKSSPGGSRGIGDILPELPPLPREEDLFTPTTTERQLTIRKVDLRVSVNMLMCKMSKEEEKCRVEVDKMSVELELSKDKVYLICNVLEGLRLMKMKGRNVYEWQGRAMLIPTMMMLRKMAEKEDVMGQLMMVRKLVEKGGANVKRAAEAGDSSKETEKLNVVMTTQKVLMMFLASQDSHIISLEEMLILTRGSDLSKLKKRMAKKRIDDICKILAGIGLLEVQAQDDENSFKYVGPEVPKIAIVDSNEKVEGQVIEDITGEMLEEVTAVQNILEDGMEVVD